VNRYYPIFISIVIVLVSATYVYRVKNSTIPKEDIGSFEKRRSCVQYPKFLSKQHISQPIAIDFSQQRFKGFAFLYGRGLKGVLHLKEWERFDHFSSYALDREGDIYITPMPFISIKERTFDLQKNIYKLDSQTGKLDIWMSIEDVKASSTNPYGIISALYDCDDDSLWVSAIDQSNYHTQKGIIYHIDTKSKKILQKIKGIDALSLALLYSQKGKYLLVGSARENRLYAYNIKDKKLSSNPIELLELPDANEHIRKIKILGKNHIRLQTIPFAYSLVAQTVEQRSVRSDYDARWDGDRLEWVVEPKL